MSQTLLQRPTARRALHLRHSLCRCKHAQTMNHIVYPKLSSSLYLALGSRLGLDRVRWDATAEPCVPSMNLPEGCMRAAQHTQFTVQSHVSSLNYRKCYGSCHVALDHREGSFEGSPV